MECKKIQELLLTDYIDGEAGDTLKNEVEEHVSSCHTCRQFKQDLLITAIEPFRKARETKAPDFVWNHIKEALEQSAIVLEEREKSGGFLANLRNYLTQVRHRGCLFSAPKPALALATGLAAVIVLMITVSRTNNQRVAKVYPEKQVEYLTRVIGDSEYFSLEENNGYGTAIEEYFF